MCVSSAIHGRRLLSFACPKESNQRKRHPRGRGHAGIPARVTARAGYGVRLGHIPVPCANARASLHAPLRANPSPARRGREGPGKSKARQSLPQKQHRISATRPQAVIPAKAGIHWLLFFGFPLKPRRRADGSAACPARGRREGSRRFGCRPWMACQPNPSARSEPSPTARARRRGCRFLWLLSFGQAKESDRRPWMVDEKPMDVSRLSKQRQNRNTGSTPSPPNPPLEAEG